MRITKDMLKAWSACTDGYAWFLRRFPAGNADYQDMLNALAEDDRANDAHWLMDRAGADDSVIEVEAIADTKHFFCAGCLVIKMGAVLTGSLRAGEGIEAGSGIEAGEGWACFAGLRVRVENWAIHARVTAKARPENLFGGCWVDQSSDDGEA